MSKYLDNNGLLYLWNSKIKPLYEKALPKVRRDDDRPFDASWRAVV